MSQFHASQVIRQEHAALASVLQSIASMIQGGPGDDAERFFDVMRAMLFYIDEFPERRHHPAESGWLFPPLLRAAPELAPVIQALEEEHAQGEGRVRELMHQLVAWELLGDSRRPAFEQAARDYIRFYLDHMRCEETRILPVAERLLDKSEWAALDAAFETRRDPLASGSHDPVYDRLFSRIVLHAPAPIGLGDELKRVPA